MPPRVAVVIPCHDDGELALQAVASVREAEPLEVVVVDDGSTAPATLAALDRLRAEGTTVVRQDNAGLGAARMAGVAATAAPYVFPLDSDDLLVEGSLARLADALDAQPRAAVAWGDYELFGDHTGLYRSPSAWPAWSLTYVNQIPVSSLIRRDALLAAGGWHGRVYEDWNLWLSFVGLGLSGVFVGGPVYRRRLHGNARLLPGARRRHQELYAELEARHAALFADRGRLRALERPAGLKRLVYPVVFGRRAVVPVPVEQWLQRQMMRFGIRLSG